MFLAPLEYENMVFGMPCVSLSPPAPQLAAGYYTEEEMWVKFKKPKKKVCVILSVYPPSSLLAQVNFDGMMFVRGKPIIWTISYFVHHECYTDHAEVESGSPQS